jgi:hypothetical protein
VPQAATMTPNASASSSFITAGYQRGSAQPGASSRGTALPG